MKDHTEAGKGSKPRPTDQDAYSKGWDLIFNDRLKLTEERHSEENKSE